MEQSTSDERGKGKKIDLINCFRMTERKFIEKLQAWEDDVAGEERILGR